MPTLRFLLESPRQGLTASSPEVRARIEEAWRPQERAIFDAYERLSGQRFRRDTYDCHLVDRLPISGYTYLRGAPMRHRPAIVARGGPRLDEVRMTLLHELAHVVTADHTFWHLRLLARLWLRHPTRRILLVTDHLIANVLHEAVAREALPDAGDLLPIAREWRGHRQAWQIIDRDGDALRHLILAP